MLTDLHIEDEIRFALELVEADVTAEKLQAAHDRICTFGQFLVRGNPHPPDDLWDNLTTQDRVTVLKGFTQFLKSKLEIRMLLLAMHDTTARSAIKLFDVSDKNITNDTDDNND